MTSDLGLFRQYLVKLRQSELRRAHGLALECNPAAFTAIASAAQCAEFVDRALRDLKELETDPGGFVRRHLKDEQ